jgi:electron transfer flavoprotein alpha subunit
MTEETLLCYSEELALAQDLVRIARSLAPESSTRVHAVWLPPAVSGAEDRLAAAGAHFIHTLNGVPSSDPHVAAEWLRSLVAELAPTLILVASTKRGRETAGRLAGALDLPITTGVSRVRIDGDGVHVDREALSGNAVAAERIVRRPAIVAVQPGATAPDAPVLGTVERKARSVSASTALTERIEGRAKPGGQLEIEKAERIVTIGRGLKKKEDLGLIEALARSLRAEVGCTRPIAAEAGWLTDDHWIGLTGHRVRPKLYLAVGVSGAVQHLVGMRSAQVVVAVNKDPNAPIFAQADYRIVGDLYQVVPALTKAFSS